MKYEFLNKINNPSDLRILSLNNLNDVSDELRHYLIETVSQCGGHFGASLGAVELTVALHYSFNTPEDKIIWDVGHQCYGHKVLTGRREDLHTIRKKDGLHPFPAREESEYDVFGVGHSSTSISAAIGMAIGSSHKKEEKKVVAVIGDGGLSAGMAFEALNHMGSINQDILVILNDNEMSISPNVGAMTNYLTKILSSKAYSTVKEGSKNFAKKVPPSGIFLTKTEKHIKGLLAPGMLFEEMGINYYGPIDGHNTQNLVKTLKNLKKIRGPKLLHVITKKGKGYLPAESDPVKYHAVPIFDTNKGVEKSKTQKTTYTKIFDNWICEMARKDPRIFAITPAMREGSGLVNFSKEFPERYIDVGIAEQHAVTLAAGLACEGLKPVVCIYSTFLQRAYDQVVHDIAIQSLPVRFAIDRAGLVGADGPTHAGSFDITYLSTLPNFIVMAASDESELVKMINTSVQINDRPSAFRYPRGNGIGIELPNDEEKLTIGKGRFIKEGKQVALVNFGARLQECLIAEKNLSKKGIFPTIFDARFTKPLDENSLWQIATNHDIIITIEEGSIGGFGSHVNHFLNEKNLLDKDTKFRSMILPDLFIDHDKPENMYKVAGLDSLSIENKVIDTLNSKVVLKKTN